MIDFVQVLLSNSLSKSIICVNRWTRWTTRGQPAQFKQMGRFDMDPDPMRWSRTVANTKYNVPKIADWSWIQLWSPILKLSSDRCFRRVSVRWNDFILQLSSPRLTCQDIHILVWWLYDSTCCKLCADQNKYHGLHCSEYLQFLLYNPVALPYAVPPVFSIPTTSLWTVVYWIRGYVSDQASGSL